MQGTVVSDAMEKSIVVEVDTYKRHRLYGKALRGRRKYLAHDENNECQIGDQVILEECRPLSKRKRWRLREIVRKAEVAPEEEAAPVDTAAV